MEDEILYKLSPEQLAEAKKRGWYWHNNQTWWNDNKLELELATEQNCWPPDYTKVKQEEKQKNKNMKYAVGGLIAYFALFFSLIISGIRADYTWEKKYEQYWSLSDKSSTLPAKQGYINKFVQALKEGNSRGEFAQHDAIFLKTPDNSFDSNVVAVETLSQRLTEIQGMNPNSFEYNTAIQQITAQEQGEASDMIHVLRGCYNLESYTIAWKWIFGWLLFFALVGIIASICAMLTITNSWP